LYYFFGSKRIEWNFTFYRQEDRSQKSEVSLKMNIPSFDKTKSNKVNRHKIWYLFVREKLFFIVASDSRLLASGKIFLTFKSQQNLFFDFHFLKFISSDFKASQV
jgi:hypothetical protein